MGQEKKRRRSSVSCCKLYFRRVVKVLVSDVRQIGPPVAHDAAAPAMSHGASLWFAFVQHVPPPPTKQHLSGLVSAVAHFQSELNLY